MPLHCQPTSIVRYRLKYFVSADGWIRITLDEDLQFHNQLNSNGPNLIIADYSDASIIAEIKVSDSNSHLLPKISNYISFTPRRFSKYCESISKKERV